MRRKGFGSLLPAISFFVVAVSLSAWVWITTDGHAASVRKQREALELEQAASRSKLRRSDADKDLILAHLAAYQGLQNRGITEGGDRLRWLEAAQEANQSLRLYGMQYTLEAATAVADSTDLERTLMKFRMPLLTESDLTAFLSALEATRTGLFWTEACALTRTGGLDPNVTSEPGLEAECELFWYHIKKATGS